MARIHKIVRDQHRQSSTYHDQEILHGKLELIKKFILEAMKKPNAYHDKKFLVHLSHLEDELRIIFALVSQK